MASTLSSTVPFSASEARIACHAHVALNSRLLRAGHLNGFESGSATCDLSLRGESVCGESFFALQGFPCDVSVLSYHEA